MTGEGSSTPSRSEAEQLIELCKSDDRRPRWLAVLRASQTEIAVATRAQPVIVELAPAECPTIRLGITPGGHVVCPLGGRRRAGVRIEATAAEIVAFLLSAESVAEAQRRGLIVVRPGLPLDRLDDLRRLVARKLRTLLTDSMAVLCALGWARLRTRRLMHGWSIELAAAADKAVPTLLATIATLSGAAAASPPTQVTVVAVARPAQVVPRPPAAAPSAAQEFSAFHRTPRPATALEARTSRAPARPPAVKRIEVSPAEPDTTGPNSWQRFPVDVNCDNTFMRVVCAAAGALPTGKG